MNFEKHNLNPEDFEKASLQKHGFIGGDSKKYVVTKNTECNEDGLKDFDDDYDEIDGFLESFEEWKEYMSSFANLDVEGMTPTQMQNEYKGTRQVARYFGYTQSTIVK